MITINQIARIAGVSRYTASKVLNGDLTVRETTRRKVMAICKEFGYVPNLNAVNLVRGQSNLIGLIVPYITDGFYSAMIELLEQRIQQHGYILIYKSSYNDARTEEQIIRKFLALKVCSMLIVPVVENPDVRMHRLAVQNVPVVYLDRPFSDDTYCVLNDNFSSARIMTEHLLQKSPEVVFLDSFYGFRNPTAAARRSGYEKAMRDHGLFPGIIAGADSGVQQDNEHYAYQAMTRFFRSGQSCKALFCVTDAAAFGAARAVREAGFSPGNDFFIGGHDNLRFGEYADPAITTMAQPIDKICDVALNLLFALLKGETPEPLQWILPSELIVRKSG